MARWAPGQIPGRDLVVVATGDAASVENYARTLQLPDDVILPAAR